MKTAKELGLKMSQSLLVRANEVIQWWRSESLPMRHANDGCTKLWVESGRFVRADWPTSRAFNARGAWFST